MAAEFWLSERQWKRLVPMLPRKSRGVPRADDRMVISSIVHVLKSGGRWVDAPVAHGPGKTLYNRFVRWAAAGIWQRVFQTLAAAGGPPAELLLDSTHIKAHRCAAGGKRGARSRRSASRWRSNWSSSACACDWSSQAELPRPRSARAPALAWR